MKALFLSHQHALDGGGGGQQQCSREYQQVLRSAGFDLLDVTFDTDRTWRTRLRRKFRPEPYANLIPQDFLARVDVALREHNPSFVFCNLYNFIPLGPVLREMMPKTTKLVILSHGLASVDEVHASRIAREPFAAMHLPKVSDSWIGRMIQSEARGLPAFDHVFCLAEFEVEICRWLGARSVSWWPRTLSAEHFLPWKPKGDRIGIVGTLDHPPNLEGVELFCAALHSLEIGPLRLRLVTRSRKIATDLQSRYPFVDVLGPLEEREAVKAEASTWNAFIHPIFCHAMGCSTKVATGLEWGLPVLTSTAGLRGYECHDGALPTFNNPVDLAGAAIEMLDIVRATEARREILNTVRLSASLADVAGRMRADLGL